MGAAMGQDPDQVEEVTRWVVEAVDIPVWAKMTPNITDITSPAAAAMRGGAAGVSAINTILGMIGINMKNLKPMPTVEGYSTPGGYSYLAVKPIALRMVAELAQSNRDMPISAIGGVTNSTDAFEHILVGGSTVQVCTGAMLQGFDMVSELSDGVLALLEQHGFSDLQSAVGHSLQYFTTHHDLVEKQAEKRALKAAAMANRDTEWGKGRVQDETQALTSDGD